MSEKSNSSQPLSKFRSYLIRLFQVFIVICLADGFLDIIYPIASLTKNNLNHIISEIKNPAPKKEPHEVILQASAVPLRNEPGIRNIIAEYHSQSINVAADGLRYNGQTAPGKVNYVGFLLGSSTAFGLGVADNQTIAAHLERTLNHTKIYNYAGFGQPTPDNILRWYDLQKKNGKPDFVILAGISYQLYNECQQILIADRPARVHSNIFLHLTDKLINKPSNKKIMPCASDESLDIAVRNSILSIENAVTFARKQGVPFYIVNLPTPYDDNVNISNISNTNDEKENILAMQRVFRNYHQELTKLDIPELIDLSHALPIDKSYFLDLGGHLSKEGNRLISEKLFDHIWDKKKQMKTRLPQHIH